MVCSKLTANWFVAKPYPSKCGACKLCNYLSCNVIPKASGEEN